MDITSPSSIIQKFLQASVTQSLRDKFCSAVINLKFCCTMYHSAAQPKTKLHGTFSDLCDATSDRCLSDPHKHCPVHTKFNEKNKGFFLITKISIMMSTYLEINFV